jgi:hypothetical protein
MSGYEPYTTELAKQRGLHEIELSEPNDGEPNRSIQFKGFERIHPMWGGHHRHEELITMDRVVRNNTIGYGGGFETK